MYFKFAFKSNECSLKEFVHIWNCKYVQLYCCCCYNEQKKSDEMLESINTNHNFVIQTFPHHDFYSPIIHYQVRSMDDDLRLKYRNYKIKRYMPIVAFHIFYITIFILLFLIS